MPIANPNAYRFIDFIGGNILDAQNVKSLEEQSLRRDKQGLGSLYEEGTLLNAVFNISGSTIHLACANYSFPVLVYVRGMFEVLIDAGGSVALPSIPSLAEGDYPFFLNWSLDIITSSDDPTLIDGATGEPTIEMGQMGLELSWTDTSGTALNSGTQFEKNTSTIEIVSFHVNGSSVITADYINGVFPYALADTRQGGLVNLTDDSGLAVGNTDPRNTDQRTPLDQSVTDPKVKDLVVTLAGSPNQYDPAAVGQGGVFSDHIIYTTLKEKLTDFLDQVNAAINSALASIAGHIGFPLGVLSGPHTTHPFPTAAQVGAAPASHVGETLGLATSHPAQVNSDHGGFTVLRNPVVTPAPTDTGYVITDGTSDLASLRHTGDVWSKLANGFNATGFGNLGLMSTIAAVVAALANATPPAGPDVNKAYVDAHDASTLATAEAYTDAHTSVAVRKVITTGAAVSLPRMPGVGLINRNDGGNGFGRLPVTNDVITYVIFTINGHIEVALGYGYYQNGSIVALPEATGWSGSNWVGSASLVWITFLDNDMRGVCESAILDPVTREVKQTGYTDWDNGANWFGMASVNTVAWRFI
jgi:hypothetical protein